MNWKLLAVNIARFLVGITIFIPLTVLALIGIAARYGMEWLNITFANLEFWAKDNYYEEVRKIMNQSGLVKLLLVVGGAVVGLLVILHIVKH